MAYTRKFNKEQEEKPFPTRLRQLTDGKYSQSEIAKYVGCTPQAIGAYMRGETVPKITDAVKIADFLNVSLDYLSGMSDVPSRNEDIQDTCHFTGLTENAVKILHGNINNESILTFINDLLSDLGSLYFISQAYSEFRGKKALEKAIDEGIISDDFSPDTLCIKKDMNFLRFTLSNRFVTFCDKSIEEAAKIGEHPEN